jgi:hypothetical protein
MADETNSNLTPEQMAARIAELEGRLAKGSSLSFKVSEKGGVSVYGLGRFPVTLYQEQWDALLSHTGELREFIDANKSRLNQGYFQEITRPELPKQLGPISGESISPCFSAVHSN